MEENNVQSQVQSQVQEPQVKPVLQFVEYNQPENPPPLEKPKSNKKKTIFTLFIIVIFLIVFGAVIIYLGNNYRNKLGSTIKVPPLMMSEVETKSGDIENSRQILSNLQNFLGVTAEIKEFKYNDWVLPEKTKIFIKGSTFSLSDGEKDTNLLNQLISKTEKYFLSSGFKINIENTSDSNQNESLGKGQKIVISKAYEKNGIYCVALFDDASQAYAVFYCGVSDDEQNKLQNTVASELQPLFNPKNDPDIEIFVQRVVGDFAVGGVGNKNGGGSNFYVKKVNGIWKKIYAGQGVLPCLVAAKYEVPTELSVGCTK
jgi:hypothetical protein